MTFSVQTLQASQSEALRGGGWTPQKLLSHFSLHRLSFSLHQILGNPPVPRLSLKIISISVCLASMLHYPVTLRFSCAHPGFTSTPIDDPLKQRREHKVITSKSQPLAYVKPETIGKYAVEKDRCGSRRCLCPQRVCQRCSYRPLCFLHKKKINSADYQASIKYLLLTSNWEKLMPCADVNNGRSNKVKGHQYTSDKSAKHTLLHQQTQQHAVSEIRERRQRDIKQMY